ncbi:unnamed protein product [Rotaria sp. Silwood1]|nr:unnamed protein product [Rotaria sp. Silwood1]CAF4866189.1 unnamed protein product [Rotaria sp. Silwood1]
MLLIYILLFLFIGFSESREREIVINEEISIGTIVFDLNSISPLSSSSLITYQLLESSSLLYFNSTTNSIIIIKRIDRDTLCPNDDLCLTCYITMKFYDIFYYDILLLKFKINDINDNQPIFNSNTYTISLTENNMPGIKIRLSKADDIDCLINNIQYYELTYIYNNYIIISKINLFNNNNNQTINNNNQPFYLEYDIINNELYLIINITLDRELQYEYIFTLTVNDYKYITSTKLTLIVLDVNDHNPKFLQTIYTINITDIIPIGTILIKLIAYDEDSNENAHIYYSLLSIDGYKYDINNQNNLFQLNSYTGELSLISNLNNIEIKTIYKLLIGASDGKKNSIPALTTVYINILNDIYNNNKSLIQITFGSNRVSKNLTEVYISENLPNATFIAYIKSDEYLEIILSDGFFIQKLNNYSYTLLTDRIYDRELRSSYNVILRNKNIQRYFNIIVTDINDCKPIWNTTLLNIDIDLYNNELISIILNAYDNDEYSNIGYRKKSLSWPQWILLITNKLIINCTFELNNTNNDCLFYLTNGEIWLDIEAYDIDNENFSSIIKIRLYKSSILGNNLLLLNDIKQNNNILQLFKHENIIIIIAILMGLLFVIATILICIYCRNELNKKSLSLITNKKINDNNNSTKQKIIQTSSSEQTSSADSLYGSEKSENITVETSDMFLFSPRRTTLIPQSSDNLTNKLFHSIQNDLSLLTETNQQIISTKGTYV